MACCKPRIRKYAEKGDWIIGTGSKNTVGQDKLVYVMEITQKMSFEKYGRDKRFKNREDSIYYEQNGRLRRKKVFPHGENEIEHDLKGRYALISGKGHYSYFGKNAIPITPEFRQIIKKGPGHKCNFDKTLRDNFINFAKKCEKGKCGGPYKKKPVEKC